jgi:hypothetical protein
MKPQSVNTLIISAIKQLKRYKYKPKAVWIDNENIYVVTDDIDRTKYAKLIKKFK